MLGPESEIPWCFCSFKIKLVRPLQVLCAQGHNHLRRIMIGASSSAKNVVYKCLVRPHLEYAWSPFTSTNIQLIESVQRRAARWICSIWNPQLHQWSKSLNDCVSELKWPSLQSRWHFLSLSILYDI